MRVVYKYRLEIPRLITGSFHTLVSLPEDARVLKFEAQDGVPTIWALVESEAPLRDREFVFCGTGHEIPMRDHREIQHVDTYQDQLGYVWHLFEVTER